MPHFQRGERFMRGSGRALAAAAVLLLLSAGAARAADEEIQVYQDEMNRKGQFGLDIHVNYVPVDPAPLDYTGQQRPVYRTRITPKWPYGLTDHIELALSLPLTTIVNNRLSVLGE